MNVNMRTSRQSRGCADLRRDGQGVEGSGDMRPVRWKCRHADRSTNEETGTDPGVAEEIAMQPRLYFRASPSPSRVWRRWRKSGGGSG